jgi:hypothetical protein
MSQTIEEQLESFKKHLWSHSQPMEFASAVVEELLMEVQRQRTVMRAGFDEIRSQIHVHQSSKEHGELQNLMSSLSAERKGFYAQYLSVAEYNEVVRRRTDLDAMARRIEILEEMGKNGEEER